MTSWSACGTILGSRATTLDALLQGDKMAKTEPKIIKFNSFDKAQRYITELGYSLKQSKHKHFRNGNCLDNTTVLILKGLTQAQNCAILLGLWWAKQLK